MILITIGYFLSQHVNDNENKILCLNLKKDVTLFSQSLIYNYLRLRQYMNLLKALSD